MRAPARIAVPLLVALGASAAPAAATWRQPVSPVSLRPDTSIFDRGAGTGSSLADIGGVPYVAWNEFDGTKIEVRVARFDGRAWVEPWTGAINQSATGEAVGPASLADVEGVPYVAWSENDGTNSEARVARLESNRWVQPWLGVSDTYGGINFSDTLDANSPTLVAVAGVPYVAWSEARTTNRSGLSQLRVARLAGARWEQPWTGVSADYGGVARAVDDVTESEVAIADVAGVPHIGFLENNGSVFVPRVARLEGSTWQEPWTGVSATSGGISSANAHYIDVAGVRGVAHVTWTENDAIPPRNLEVHVARLAGSSWVQPWTGVSATSGGINHDTTISAFEPSLAAGPTGPLVAWREAHGAAENETVRVARLAGSRWDEPWTGVDANSGAINQSDSEDASEPGLAMVGGLPWLSWEEDAVGVRQTAVRVARLEPEFQSASATPQDTTATLRAQIRTYGFPFPVGFDYGKTLESRSGPAAAPIGTNVPTISRTVKGLEPSTAYQYRAFATAGVPAPRVLETRRTFITLAPQPTTPGGPQTTTPTGGGTAPSTRARCRRVRVRGVARVRCTITFPRAATRRLSVRLAARGRTYARGSRRSKRRSVTLLLTVRRRVAAGRYTLVVVNRAGGKRRTVRITLRVS